MKCTVYVDGSFAEGVKPTGDKVGIYGSGVCMLIDGLAEPYTRCFGGSDTSISGSRNVTGEVIAVLRAMAILDKQVPEVDEVDIYYDYKGVACWYTGEWKANSLVATIYKEDIRKYAQKYKLNFHHVNAHTGVFYNEMADRLAKDGVRQEATRIGARVTL